MNLLAFMQLLCIMAKFLMPVSIYPIVCVCVCRR